MSIDTKGGHPAMDYNEHVRTYQGFVTGTKWGVGLLILVLALMAFFLL